MDAWQLAHTYKSCITHSDVTEFVIFPASSLQEKWMGKLTGKDISCSSKSFASPPALLTTPAQSHGTAQATCVPSPFWHQLCSHYALSTYPLPPASYHLSAESRFFSSTRSKPKSVTMKNVQNLSTEENLSLFFLKKNSIVVSYLCILWFPSWQNNPAGNGKWRILWCSHILQTCKCSNLDHIHSHLYKTVKCLLYFD